MAVHVSGLPWSFTNDDLERLVAQHTPVKSAKVVINPDTGKSRGYGFVTLVVRHHHRVCPESAPRRALSMPCIATQDESQVDAILGKLRGMEVGGRILACNYARSQDGRNPNPQACTRLCRSAQLREPGFMRPL